MHDDARIWRVYNKRSKELDDEMLREWNDTLNTLLIFVRAHMLIFLRSS